jgi:PAS domain S-box-containing protein
VNAAERADISLDDPLRTLLEAESACLKVLSAGGELLDINAAGAALLDADSASELIGARAERFLAPEYQASFASTHARVVAGERLSLEFEIVGVHGTRHWVESRGVPFAWGGSREPAALYVTRDVTARRAAEAELRSSEDRYRHIVEHTRDIIYRTDANGRFTFCNPATHAVLGYTPAELIGLRYIELIHPDYRGTTERFYVKQFMDRVPATYYEFPAVSRTGRTVWFEQEVQLLQTGDRILGFQAVCRDISERVRADKERRRLEAKALHTEKLESLGVMAGGIAHDFNNLLTVMVGNASLAARLLPPDSEAAPFLEEIDKAGRRAADLAQRMLDYAGKTRPVFAHLRLDDMARDLSTVQRPALSRKATLVLDLASAEVSGDHTQVRQVMMNLITNASDALGADAGTITVRVGLRDMDSASLSSPYIPDEPAAGTYAFMQIEDTGSGMSPELLARIFDPFFTTKFTGRGLGLAAVLGIVRAHKGSISATSEPGRGSVFTVYLPAAAPEPVAEAEPISTWADWRGTGTVLLVEDDDTLRVFARRVLENAGFDVLEAGDGRAGLELFERHRHEIRGAVVDLTMPQLDGFEVLATVRRSSNVPVLLMSGYAEAPSASRAAKLGANGFLHKPFRPADLLAKVLAMLPTSK